MTQIALYDYLEQINQFLENEQTTEAITHCRHVLRQYPRHVQSYRLLARALLENREFEDAAELFHRILSADPNDFVSHVGLAEIYREAGELSEAVWHMERAFEMSPYDSTVYEVLRDLYSQRDGEMLSEIPLTRAALARLYFKGELYQEAASELRTILQQNGDDRVDLEVLLSETLWRDNQRVDAVAVALKILEKLPDSITVNAILGEVWLLTGRTEEAQRYLQHLLSLTQMDQKQLDLDSVVGQAFQTEGAPPLPKTIMVERWRAAADAARSDAGTRVGTEQPIEDEAVYDWLREGGGTDMLGALVDEEDETDWFTDRLELPSDQGEAFAKTAEWLDSLGVEPESGDDFDFVADMPLGDEPVADDEILPLMDDAFPWSDETANAYEPDEVVQDWLTERDDTPAAVADEDGDEPSDWFAMNEETDEADGSDWFDNLLEDESKTELTDWFDETPLEVEMEDAPESEVVHTADLLAQTSEEDLDWLVEEEEDAAIKGSQELSELAEASFTEESLAGDDEILPDWLMEIGESPDSFDFGQPESEGEIDLFVDNEEPVGTGDLFASDIEEWSKEEEPGFNTADLLANANEGLPDWLTEEEPKAEERITGGLSDILGTTGLFSDTDLPDWLSDEDDETDAEPEEQESGLIGRMNRLMDTDELFSEETIDIEFEEEPEEIESEPLSLTGLLLGTTELAEQEAVDELFEADEDTLDADESESKVVTGGFPALLGTAELLADLGTEIPDWLQENEPADEQPESPLQTTDLQGEGLDEVPHWLFREEEEPEVEEPEEQPPKTSGARSGLIGTAELFASLGEDVPDWISETDEEEDEEDVSSPARSGLMGTAELLAELDVELPEWAGDEGETTGWQTSDKDSQESPAEVEEDDWLRDEALMDEAITDIVEEATPPTKSLLDWLSSESASNVETEPDEADEEELPDWLFSDTSQDEMEVVIMADNEQENNLEEMPDDSDDMDWLEDLVAQDDAPDIGKRASSVGEGDLPDWLSNLTEPATESEAALSEEDDIPLTLTDSDLPDWLKDLGEATTPAQPAISGSMENLPDWLKPPPDLDLGSKPGSDLELAEADALPEFDDDVVGDDDDFLAFVEADQAEKDDTSQIWLDALAADEDDFDLEAEPISGAGEEELPDWLALSGDEAEITVETGHADEDESVLDFLTDSDDESFLDEIGDDLDFARAEAEASDWLAALSEDIDEDGSEDEDELVLDFLTDSDDESLLDEISDDLDFAQAEAEASDWLAALSEDIDDVPDWLTATAGEDADLEVEEIADDFVDETIEELPDWLAASALADEDEAGAITTDDEADELLPEFSLDDVDLPLDDPMAWLEQLAVEQDEPVEDLPSVLDTSMYDAIRLDDLDDSADTDEEKLVADEEAAMAHLEALAKEQEADLDEEMLPPEEVVDIPDSELLQMLELDIEEADEIEAVALADELLADDAEDESALSWLDALDETDDFDELTTVVAATTDESLADFDMQMDELPEDDVDLTLPDLTVGDGDEVALDWLDALDESEAVLAGEMETAVTPTEDFLETVEVPDDLEEAIAWLQDMEAEAEEPDEELPTLDELLLIEEGTDSVEMADIDDDGIGWLAELAAEDVEESAAELPTPAEIEVEPEPPDPLQEALDQLEELALQDSASLLTTDVSDNEAVEVESLDEVLDWLEAQLTAPTVVKTADEPLEIIEESEDISPSDTSLVDETMIVEAVTMDVEAVILEEEAADDSSLLEERLDLSELEESTEAEELAIASDEMDDEMSDDDIMAFMDAILEDDDAFVPEKDVSFNPDDPDAAPSFATSAPVVEAEPEEEVEGEEFLDVMADITEEVGEAEVLAGMYDDLSDDDDILAFMDSIFEDDDAFIPEKDVSFNPDDPNAAPSFAMTETSGNELDNNNIDDVPDDSETAIAWLEDLAEAQEADEDVESILPEIDEDFALDLFADVAEVEEQTDSQDVMEFDETLADSLPDWLEFDGEERLSGHTDWLRSLPEPDVAGWLEAEEEVMASNIFDEIPVPLEPERLSGYTSDLEDTLASEPEAKMIEAESELDEETPTSSFSLNTGALDKARQDLVQGEYERAMNQYRSLVEEGQGLSALIADLETATEEYQQPLLRRLLGDAYMRNGQLQRALETYRIALDEL